MPNPGSREAMDMGCRCPVWDNCSGEGVGKDPDTGEKVFWISSDCPLHGVDRLPMYKCTKCGFATLDHVELDKHIEGHKTGVSEKDIAKANKFRRDIE
jgi:hypothetical protein